MELAGTSYVSQQVIYNWAFMFSVAAVVIGYYECFPLGRFSRSIEIADHIVGLEGQAPPLTITGPVVQKVVAAVSSASRDMVTDRNPFEFRFVVNFLRGTNSLGAIYSDGEYFRVYQGPFLGGLYHSGMHVILLERRQYKFKSDIINSLVFVPVHKEYNKYRDSLPK